MARRSANETLLRASILRSSYLEQLKNGNVKRTMQFVNGELVPDVMGLLGDRMARIGATGRDRGPLTTERLTGIATDLSGIFGTKLDKDGYELITDDLSKLSNSEARWQVSSLASATKGFGVEYAMPSPATLRAIVHERAPFGNTIKEHLAGISRGATQEITKELRLGLAQGETVDQLMRRVQGTIESRYDDGVFGKVRRNVETVVRTSAAHVSAQAREETLQANAEVVDKVRLVATLDTKTSRICIAYDGQVFPINEGPRPPFHPNCRTLVTTILKRWEDLSPNLAKRFKEADDSGDLRESMDGNVPANITYPEWLEDQPEEVQREVLGTTRWEMWKAGDLDLTEMVNDRGKERTIEELDELTNVEGVGALEEGGSMSLSAAGAQGHVVEIGGFNPDDFGEEQEQRFMQEVEKQIKRDKRAASGDAPKVSINKLDVNEDYAEVVKAERQWIHGLTKQQKAALGEWTGTSHDLRMAVMGKPVRKDSFGDVSEIAPSFVEAIEASPKFKGTVFRGVSSKIEVGKTVSTLPMTSWTTDINTAANFASDKGGILYVEQEDLVSILKFNEDESEVIQPHELKLKVTGRAFVDEEQKTFGGKELAKLLDTPKDDLFHESTGSDVGDRMLNLLADADAKQVRQLRSKVSKAAKLCDDVLSADDEDVDAAVAKADRALSDLPAWLRPKKVGKGSIDKVVDRFDTFVNFFGTVEDVLSQSLDGDGVDEIVGALGKDSPLYPVFTAEVVKKKRWH